MAVYAITGKLGSGKGKGAVQRMREYLKAGKRVAGNIDVFLEHLMPIHSRRTVQRVPDKPCALDLYALGSGNPYIEFENCVTRDDKGNFVVGPHPDPKILPGFDESYNGGLFLDECGSWLNARTFSDAGRAELLEWCIHARKYGWDVFFVMQNVNQIDKQLRESLFEYVVRMSRLDRMKIPVLSAGVKLATAGAIDGRLPRVHIGTVRLGTNPDALMADRWVFRGDDLNAGYNTTQVFSTTYPHAAHSLLPAWHLEGHKHAEPVPPGVRLLRRLGLMPTPKPPRRVVHRQASRYTELLRQLPPDERFKHFKRLQAIGVL